MKYSRVLVLIIALSLVLGACQAETEPTSIPVQVEEAATAAPEATKEPTAEPATEPPPQPTERPVVEPPSPEDAGVLPMDQFYIDALGLDCHLFLGHQGLEDRLMLLVSGEECLIGEQAYEVS